MNNNEQVPNLLAPERVQLAAAVLAGLTNRMSATPSPEMMRVVAATAVEMADMTYHLLTKKQLS